MVIDGLFNKILILFVGIALFTAGCSKNSNKELKAAIESYRNNENGALERIQQALINSCTLSEYDDQSIRSHGRVVYTVRSNSLKTIIPEKHEITLPVQFPVDSMSIDVSKNYIGIMDGKALLVFNEAAEMGQPIIIGDEKEKVTDLLLNDNYIYFYKEYRLHVYDFKNEKHYLASNDTFLAPYPKLYSTSLKRNNDKVCLVIGMAGSYYISIINIVNKSVLQKNIMAASSKCMLLSDKLYYIEGGAGNWDIVSYQFDKKSKIKVSHFNDISNIHVGRTGYFSENKKGLYYAIYGQKQRKVPFKISIVEIGESFLLVKMNNRIHLVDSEKLFVSLDDLARQIPDIYN